MMSPPQMKKLGFQVKVTFFILDDVSPPPRNEKVGSQVNMTYWFWMMYPPPPPLIEINMNAIENNWGQQVLFTNLPPPPPHSIILFMPEQETGEFQFQSDMDTWTQNPICHPSSSKIEMLVFGLHSNSDDRLGWLMDSNPIHHPSPAQKMKCSFLDYIQLLMIGQAIQAKNVDRNAKK